MRLGARTVSLALATLMAMLTLLPQPLAAQEATFPSKALRIVVPYPPGASTDAISRAAGELAARILAKPVIVENRPGGGTVIGTRIVRQAPADGYTLMFQSASLGNNLYAFKEPGYSFEDFTAVALLSETSYVLLTPSSLPAKNLKEFVAYAKANSDKMNYGSLGAGTKPGTLGDRLGKAAGFNWTEISFKGTAESAQAVMAGSIQGYFSTQAFALTQAESPKLRLMGIAAPERSSFLPNVPTFKELGLPQIVEQSWYALFVRSDTPKPIIDQLQKAFTQVMGSDEYAVHLRNNGLSPYKGTLDGFPARMRNEADQFAKDMAQFGVQPQ